MRVENRPAAFPTSPAGSRRAEPGARFSLADAGAAAQGGSVASSAPLAGLDAILTLQAGEEAPQERRRRSVKRGHDLLDGLDRLKAALLGGRVATQELRTIANRLAERAGSSGDPRLDALMSEIELRAAVELAKIEFAKLDRSVLPGA